MYVDAGVRVLPEEPFFACKYNNLQPGRKTRGRFLVPNVRVLSGSPLHPTFRPHFLADLMMTFGRSCSRTPFKNSCVRCIALLRSSSLTMLYLSKIERVLCPLILIATFSGTPARTMFLTAVLRKSWKSLPA